MDLVTLALAKKYAGGNGGGSGSGGVTSWNDLTDKPFGEEQAFEPIVWDGSIDEANAFALGDTLYAKISDTILTTEQLEGAEFFSAEGNTWYIYSEDTGLGIVACNARFGTDVMSNVVISVYDKDTANAQGATIPSNGVYSFADPEMGTFVLSITKSTIKPLDEKYLPTLTSPSGKKFKLSVSDDGTLIATEVN